MKAKKKEINPISMTISPNITNPILDIAVETNAPDTTLNLLASFDDPSTTGKTARFQLENTSLGSSGVINILLFDQTGVGAPLSVQNFLNYVNRSDYTNSIIHRLVKNFVVQGGGYVVENRTPRKIDTDPPVQNEFSTNRSNLRGTIAYAKLGDAPNSATSEWFFNLGNNSANLDNQNGGFTVFGQVLGNADLVTIDAIANLTIVNAGGTFDTLPVINTPLNTDDDLVRFSSITSSQLNELQFSVVSNSNPNLVNVTVNGTNLQIDYLNNQNGSADITLRATTLLGVSIEDTFNIKVTEFDPAQYGASYLDLIQAYGYNLDAFSQHYFNSGKSEGRSRDSFDEKNYLASYDDLLGAFGTDTQKATEHYISSGALIEKRNIYVFNPSQYLASYNDLLSNLGNNPGAAKDHFIQSGWQEGRSRDSFKEDIYLASHGDLITAFKYDLEAATQHYLNSGAKEGRAKEIFDPVSYLNTYQDLQAAFGNDLTAATRHYIEYGFNEGRTF